MTMVVVITTLQNPLTTVNITSYNVLLVDQVNFVLINVIAKCKDQKLNIYNKLEIK